MAKSAIKKGTARNIFARSTSMLKGVCERYSLVVSYTLLTLVLSITLSWVVLAKGNFLYGVWHDYGGIGQAIDKYGPMNQFKTGFGDTTRAERIRLFAAINRSVHQGGDGLRDIYFQTPSSMKPQQMLREPEVVHLQDVANLIDVLFWIGFGASLLWLGVSSYLLLVKRTVPGGKEQSVAMLAVLALCGAAVIIIGPNTVFSAFHIWVFPDDHQWFFYYQKSLMSTLMYAPYLFAWIAGAMVILAVLIFMVLQVSLSFAANWVARRHTVG